MKRQPQSFRLMLASAIALATLVTTAMPVAQAQGDTPPAATPIPLPEDMASTAPVVPEPIATAQPAQPETAMSPQATQTIAWLPASGVLAIDNAGKTTVRVSASSDEGGLNGATATYELFDANGFQPPVAASASAVGSGNSTFDLTASGLASVNASTTQIKFNIRRLSDNSLVSSQLYSLSRGGPIKLPAVYKVQGGSNNVTTLTTQGFNACDSVNRVALHPGVRHNVQNPTGDNWFTAINRINGGSIVVSLANFAPAFSAQLQVWYNNPTTGCNPPTYLTLGLSPNPVVVVSGVPAGNVFFRVVSGADQSGNRPVPAPFIISWNYNTGTTGGSGSEIEPNNNTCQPTPLPERAVFTANDNDQFDFYSITITQSGQILLLMENHNTVGTQVQVRAPIRYNGIAEADCQSSIPAGLRKDPYVEPIGNVTSVGARVLSRAGGLVFPGGNDGDTAGVLATPQTWFIRVATPNSTGQSNRQYTIRWVFLPPGVSAYPFMDKMTQTGPARGSDPLLRAGDPFDTTAREKWYYSFFWANMDKISGGAADTIQFGIDSFQLDGCPNAQFPPDPGRTVPAGFGGNWVTVSNQSSGAMTWKFNKSGAYKVRFRALRAGAVVSSDEKPLRVDCGFTVYNFGGLWPLGNDTATPGSPLIGPEKPADWVEPIP